MLFGYSVFSGIEIIQTEDWSKYEFNKGFCVCQVNQDTKRYQVVSRGITRYRAISHGIMRYQAASCSITQYHVVSRGITRDCFIYILDSSNSSSLTFWTSQFGSSSRSKWTGIWTGNSNGSWTDKQSSHFSTTKEMSVKAIFFFM